MHVLNVSHTHQLTHDTSQRRFRIPENSENAFSSRVRVSNSQFVFDVFM